MADLALNLRWQGDGLVFRGGATDGPELVLDGNAGAAPSPVQVLGLSLAGCMASDVVLILEKGRVPFAGLDVQLRADRRAEPPRYLTRVTLTFTVRGLAVADEEKVKRAVALSQETYCSVLHTFRQDIAVRTDVVLA
jgi:putative redox protein